MLHANMELRDGPPADGLDVIETGAGASRPIRRILVVLALVALAVAGYTLTHRQSPAGPDTVAGPGPPPGIPATPGPPSPSPEPVPEALVMSASRAAASAAQAEDARTGVRGRHVDGGGVGVQTIQGSSLVGAEGAAPGSYQVTLVCVGHGTVLVYLSDSADPSSGLPSALMDCRKARSPAVTVQVTLRQPAFVLLAQPGSGTVAGLGWSVHRT